GKAVSFSFPASFPTSARPSAPNLSVLLTSNSRRRTDESGEIRAAQQRLDKKITREKFFSEPLKSQQKSFHELTVISTREIANCSPSTQPASGRPPANSRPARFGRCRVPDETLWP